MERTIILKNTATGQAVTLPVTPSGYPMAGGREAERLDMAQTGQIALPGLRSLFTGTLEVLLPAKLYPFCAEGAVADPRYYLDLFTAWSDSGDVCRYIVSGAGVNAAVLLGPIEYGEEDGSNDVYAKIPLYEYCYLDEVVVEQTQNTSRPAGDSGQSAAAGSYVVVAGDSLWSICKRFYGDGSLAYQLAAANGIANPDLIFPGQVLTLPTLDGLSAWSAAASSTSSTARETEAEARAGARASLGLRASPSDRNMVRA